VLGREAPAFNDLPAPESARPVSAGRPRLLGAQASFPPVSLELVLLAAAFAFGLAVQSRYRAEALRASAWTAYFWTLTPALVFYAFSTVTFDRELTLALTAAILSSWLVIGLGLLYALLVARERDERGALALGAGFPNTGFVGYPLAQIAFGAPGLALMVIYDRLAMLVPSTAVSTAIARLHGRRQPPADRARQLAVLLVNPPLLAMAGAIALRIAGWELPGLDRLGALAGDAIGPAGFFLLGLSLPLERAVLAATELKRAAGALAIRFAVAPLVLLACGLVLGARVPDVFVLAAAMPCAFHLLVLARVFDVRPQLMRVLVVASTVAAVIAVVAGNALL
jgi:malonate transporter and related proteins